MITIAVLIAMAKSTFDTPDYSFVIVTGLFDLVGLIVIGITVYNLFELYLRCGGLSQ